MNGKEVDVKAHLAVQVGIHRDGSLGHVSVPPRTQILQTVSGELQHADAVLIEEIERPPNRPQIKVPSLPSSRGRSGHRHLDRARNEW